MVDLPAGLPAPTGPPPVPAPGSGPCAPARAEVDSRCAEAERLSQAAAAHVQRLREAKRMLADARLQRESDARVRDRRLLADAKENARRAYHERFTRATADGSAGGVQDAAGEWLREIDRLNRQLGLADRRADEIARTITELETALPGIELAADAARIAAEAGQVACVEARRALAECEETAARHIRSAPAAPQAPRATMPAVSAGPAAAAAAPALASASRPPGGAGPAPTVAAEVAPVSLLLRGDRQALLGLTLRLAEETGVEAGRLQLMLLELRQAIAMRALEDVALAFPADHPFWSQFPADARRQLAVALAALGYAFDGRGWRDGRAPGVRELATAVAHIGFDPRMLRRPAGQAAIDELWQGTTVRVEEWLIAQAPDLSVERLIQVLGTRASRLGELWDMWGRLRPRLLPGIGTGT